MAKNKGKNRSVSILESVHALHAAHNRLMDKVISPFQISNEQYNVLRILSSAPDEGMSLKQIQMLVPNNTSNTTRLVDKLRQKKLLNKASAKTDKRELRIRITPEGVKTLSDVEARTEAVKKNLKKISKGKNAKVLDSELKSALTTMEKIMTKV